MAKASEKLRRKAAEALSKADGDYSVEVLLRDWPEEVEPIAQLLADVVEEAAKVSKVVFRPIRFVIDTDS